MQNKYVCRYNCPKIAALRQKKRAFDTCLTPAAIVEVRLLNDKKKKKLDKSISLNTGDRLEEAAPVHRRGAAEDVLPGGVNEQLMQVK